jgi:hypothetical protein
MPQQSFLQALFGKKKRVKRTKSTSVSKKGAKKTVMGKKPPAALRKKCKKHKIRTTTGKKHRTYKTVAVLKRALKKKERAMMKKKKALALKKAKRTKKPARKRTKKPATKRRSRSRTTSRFGKGVPLSQMISPYPYAVNSSPPWI